MNDWLYDKWGVGLQALGRFLRETLYPEGALCLGCGKISDGRPLCPACRESLRSDGAAFAWQFTDLQGLPAYSLREHRDLPRQLVLRLKHRAEACLAREMVEILLPLPAFWSPPPGTVVTWVAMPASRRRERGIDHGQRLAEAFAEKLNLPCRPLLLRRDTRHRAQATLNRTRRKQNLRQVFEPLGPITFPVLLVDDVLTTGTTALRCAEALRKGGATDITALTFTRAVGRRNR
jgi:predicted amidophosphoribosyltransferase